MPRAAAEAAPLACEFKKTWGRCKLDAAATSAVYFVASAVTGRVWRYPFDDELTTLVPNVPAVFGQSLSGTARYFLGGYDLHPPTVHVLYPMLFAWLSEPTLRLISVAMTAGALVLWQLLALATISDARGEPVPAATRLVATLLFGLSPMAVSQGDAIRWYPPFALLVALAAALYLAAGGAKLRLAAAVPLGLAASINLIAPLVAIPLAIYRYLLQRKWRLGFDLPFWGIAAVFAAPGLVTAAMIAWRHLRGVVAEKFGASPLDALAIDVIGFFGGHAVGIGEAWVVVPLAAIAAVAFAAEIDRRAPAAPIHLCLLLLAAMVLAALLGFSEPRSFLYLAPVLALSLTVFLDRQFERRGAGIAVLATCCAVLPSIAAIASHGSPAHPFKRNAVAPFAEIVDFVTRNESGDTLVISTDPVVLWELAKRGSPHRCLSYFLDAPACLGDARRYQSIFVVSGHSSRSDRAPDMLRYSSDVARVIGNRQPIAEARFGRDADAMLKTRLTGVPLDEFILTVSLYR